ncbi:MAG TPA: hypothetical protein ENO28_08410 [Bacteroidetes bacterium]|nr:hypothetical protein [Bacteroidota bacterium]
MKDKRTDILKIRQYLKGELSPEAMHQLEREAQADPFLMDALEGYANTPDHEPELGGLQSRLQERISGTRPTRKLIPWPVIAIAASVTGFVIIAGLFFYKGDKPGDIKKELLVNQEKPSVAPLTKPDSTATISRVPTAQPEKEKSSTPVAPMEPKQMAIVMPPVVATQKADSVAANGFYSAEMADKKPAGTLATIKPRIDTILGGAHVAVNKTASQPVTVLSRAEGAGYTQPDARSTNAAYLAANLPPALSGVVLDKADGSPIPGATVKIAGQASATQTDANGRFSLRRSKAGEDVTVNFLGYNSKTLSAKNGDSIKVELEPSNNSLAEVVVAAAKPATRTAGPMIGMPAYRRYLDKNARLPGVAGTVTLQFTVDSKGALSNFKVISGLGKAADNKAINLVKNGPGWLPSSAGITETVKLAIQFR